MIRIYKKLFILLVFIFISTIIYAQQHVTLKGKILEQETGLPLVGASVSVKENSKSGAAISGSTGGFLIKAHVGQTLVVSYIGYSTKEIIIKAENTNLVISLDFNNKLLSEVVVTGALGIKRSARELGTSAQIVSNEYLNQGETVNPLFGLTSKVAGLRINASDPTNGKVDALVQIRLRGTRSFNDEKNNPIYVVDGVPIPEIGRLNPNDIESITVLKGANAAALYGSEGVNGALMITTKSGARGQGVVNYSNSTAFSNIFLLPPAQTTFGQGQNGTYIATEAESWGPKFDGSMQNFGAPINGVQPQILFAAPSKDNRLEMFDTGRTLQNDLSFSGGDEKSTYFMSVQNVEIKGVIPGDESSRTGGRFNGSRKFGKLNTSYNFNYIYYNRNSTDDGPWASTYSQPANIDWSGMRNWEDPQSIANPLNWYSTATGTKNPFFLMDNFRDRSKQQTFNGKIELDYEFTSWFKAIYRVGLYSVADETRRTTNKLFSTLAYRNVNGAVNDGSNNFRRLNNDLILSFNKDFGKFSTRLLVGQNVRLDDRKVINIESRNLLLPDLFNQDSRTGELTGGATLTQYRSLGTYGEFTAGYNNYLFLTLTGRNDQVSVLSKNNRSYFYPGVSTSFVFSEAIDALKNNPIISFGKVFASYNRTGNVTLDPYKLNSAYTQTAGFPYGSLVGFTPGLTNPNHNIEPEFVASYETGLQLGLFKNRLNFDVAYIYSDSDGQIFEALTSSATGYNNAFVNAGRLTNKIIELSINGDVIQNKNFKWNLGFNFTHIKNEVKELYSGTEFRTFRQSYAIVGEAFPSLKVSDYARDPQGRVIVDANGNTTTLADATHLGTMVPPYQMGINTMLNFKGISIGAQFDGRLGGWIYSEVVPRMYTAGTHPATVEYDRQPFVFPNSVVKNLDGSFSPNTTVTSTGNRAFWDNQGKIQINTAAKADFLKLRELYVSYEIPKSLLANQKFIKGASVGFVGNNLFIIRHKDNKLGDPESLYNQTDGYLSFRQIPASRILGFNVNVTF